MAITRDEIQKEAVEQIMYKTRGILEWCTSLGKSRVAIEILKLLYKDNPKLKVLLLVAETAHKDNWRKEFIKWGLDITSLDITIECYASLKNCAGEYDLYIGDEIHRAFSEIRVHLLKTIKAKYIVMLSATLEFEMKVALFSIYGKFYISMYTLQYAIEHKLLSKPSIYLIPLTLDNISENETILFSKGKEDLSKRLTCKYKDRWSFMNSKYPNIRLSITCTKAEKYEYLTGRFDYFRSQFMRSRDERVKNRWLQVGSERKRFLGESKSSEVAPLLSILKGKRYVCFCSTIKQSELFCTKTCIHSKKKDSQDLILKFNNKEIDSLYPIGMIQEGQNLTDLDLGIIVQLDGVERSFIQRFGRVLRAEDPILIIYFYRNTRDEEYLDKVLEGISTEYITTINNINELKNIICK